MTGRLTTIWRGMVRYLRQVSGEAKWDDYVARCAADGVAPVTRREFERHRAGHKERDPRARCC